MRPSQINLSRNGARERADSRNKGQNGSASKSDSSSAATESFLKQNLYCLPTRQFHAIKEACLSDLEKKTFNSSLLVASRALLNQAKKDYEYHCYALSCVEKNKA